jgi:hypothetical protein
MRIRTHTGNLRLAAHVPNCHYTPRLALAGFWPATAA